MPDLQLISASEGQVVPHLSVDGMTPAGPNLSHWPGNRTPPQWKADLSTGICLNFARVNAADQESFLAGVTHVLNDHYDTDGFLSLLAVLRPELAMAHEELVLLAAATGDYQSFQTWRGFAIDRIVLRLADTERSPVASEFTGLSGDAKDHARYRWLLDHAEEVLTQPDRFRAVYEDELASVRQQIRASRAGGLRRELHRDLGLSILTGADDLHRMVLNSLAGAWRVLHIRSTADGNLYRYHDRTESWFEVVTFAPPTRRDLRPLRDRLQELELEMGPGHGDGDTGSDGAGWFADPPTEPIPELYHGLPGHQEYGQINRRLTPSRLPASVVTETVRDHFGRPMAVDPMAPLGR